MAEIVDLHRTVSERLKALEQRIEELEDKCPDIVDVYDEFIRLYFLLDEFIPGFREAHHRKEVEEG